MKSVQNVTLQLASAKSIGCGKEIHTLVTGL